MSVKEKVLAYGIEALIGRLFTDSEFLRVAKEHPKIVTLSYNLSKREVEDIIDLIKQFGKISATELAKGIAASGHGCSAGGSG